MLSPRIKEIQLADQIDPQELEWLSMLSPTINYLNQRVTPGQFEGTKVTLWQHITLGDIPFFLTLKKMGFEVYLGACNVESTNDYAAAYLVKKRFYSMWDISIVKLILIGFIKILIKPSNPA